LKRSGFFYLHNCEPEPIAAKDVVVDQEAEVKRPKMKRQAKEWAGLAQDPNSDLFVFVGRWSKQKAVDLIADTMSSMYVPCLL
jgi:alpha-1,3-glucan synthase